MFSIERFRISSGRSILDAREFVVTLTARFGVNQSASGARILCAEKLMRRAVLFATLRDSTWRNRGSVGGRSSTGHAHSAIRWSSRFHNVFEHVGDHTVHVRVGKAIEHLLAAARQTKKKRCTFPGAPLGIYGQYPPEVRSPACGSVPGARRPD